MKSFNIIIYLSHLIHHIPSITDIFSFLLLLLLVVVIFVVVVVVVVVVVDVVIVFIFVGREGYFCSKGRDTIK